MAQRRGSRARLLRFKHGMPTGYGGRSKSDLRAGYHHRDASEIDMSMCHSV